MVIMYNYTIAIKITFIAKHSTVEAVDGGEFIKKTEERLAKLRDGRYELIIS